MGSLFFCTFATMSLSSGNQKRYNSYSEWVRNRFGGRVQKLTIDAGFTCPNRDGTKGTGGCTYCNNDAFNPSYCHSHKSITQQIEEGIQFHKVRYRRASNYLAYFQAFSNTYAPLNVLKKLYGEALAVPGVKGLVIGTRPDCMDDEKLEYLSHLNKTHFVSVEYGIESCYNETLKRINRGHTFEETAEAIEKTAKAGIHTGSHLIFGLPGESREQMMEQADIINQLPLSSIKFHQLQIIEGTTMASQYKANPSQFDLFTLEEYIDFVISFTERLRPGIVIERFSSEAPPRFQAGPTWGMLRTDQVMNLIDNAFKEKNTFQGRLYQQNRTA